MKRKAPSGTTGFLKTAKPNKKQKSSSSIQCIPPKTSLQRKRSVSVSVPAGAVKQKAAVTVSASSIRASTDAKTKSPVSASFIHAKTDTKAKGFTVSVSASSFRSKIDPKDTNAAKSKYLFSRKLQQELLELCRKTHGGVKNLNEQEDDVELMITQIDTYNSERQPVEQIHHHFDDDTQKFIPRKPILRIYGNTKEGKTILVHVHGFKPYFYVRVSDNLDFKQIKRFETDLNEALRIEYRSRSPKTTYILSVHLVKDKTSIYGYTAPENRTNQTFLKVTMKQPVYVGKARKLLHEGILTSEEFLQKYETFEANVLFVLRFMVDRNLSSGTWIRIPKGKYFAGGTSTSNCNMEIDTQCLNIECLGTENEWSQIPPLKILSMDLEAQGQHGHFPDGKKDPCIQIGSMFQISNGKDTFGPNIYVIHALKTCEPLSKKNLPESFQDEKSPIPFLISHETEEEMLLNWAQMVQEMDPDLLVGYNIEYFDYPYLMHRAKALGIEKDFVFGRIKNQKCEMQTRMKNSQQSGKRETYEVTVPGRIIFDVLSLVREEAQKLRSYTLNNVALHYLKLQKEDVHHTLIPKLQNGSDNDRTRLALYCLKDAILPIRLMDKLMFIINKFEMTRVSGITLSLLTQRGQQLKVFSQLLRKSRMCNLILPTLDHQPPEEFKGADVITPVSGYYEDPITVLDFSALYPSIMIAHNLCFCTYIANPFQQTTNFLDNSCEKTPVDKYFVKSTVKQGLLPTILKEILAARTHAKNLMKEEKDSFRKAVYNGRQLALKIAANSVYGFTGATFGLLACLAISSSVTGYGREMLQSSKLFLEDHYSIKNGFSSDTKVVYGDTDSVFVNFGVKDLETCMKLGKEASKLVSKLFPPPIELDFEKCYYPLLLHAKKRYAGLYWSTKEKYDKIDFKGMEVARRENCKLVTEILNKVMETIFIERNIPKAAELVKNTVSDLYMDKIDMSLLIMRKGLGKNEKEYKAKNLAHLQLVKKMQKRDITTAPRMGDPVWYVFVGSTKNKKTKVGDILEDPPYVLAHKIPLCPEEYVEKQLRKPLSRIFQHLLPEKQVEQLWKGKHTLVRRPPHLKAVGSTHGMFKFLSRNRTCQKCQAVLTKAETRGLCTQCEPHRTELTTQMVTQQNFLEETCQTLHDTCVKCQDGTPYKKIDCHNMDCSIFFKRTKMDENLVQCQTRVKEMNLVRGVIC